MRNGSMMEHKAYLFDYESFSRELKGILEAAIQTHDPAALVSFIRVNVGNLRDPYEGKPLERDWESLIETRDAHQYGDFALTKYYDPLVEIGLGTDWNSVQELIALDRTLTESPILGSTIGPPDEPFDPGKMGSYFQTDRQVGESHEYLLKRAEQRRLESLASAIEMLQKALQAGTGLYV